jgi:Na+-transporting methylmalonyl-CoA/oxaloacetate decarboxylase beta subunit
MKRDRQRRMKNKEKVEKKERVDIPVTIPVISQELGEELMLKIGGYRKIQPRKPRRR